MEFSSLEFRVAGESDVPVLAALNGDLIEDEAHRNTLSETELAKRMAGWIGDQGEYRAILFFEEADRAKPIAYALFKAGENEIYLRQFFVSRDGRRQGIGRAAMKILFDQVWPQDIRLTVDVLFQNQAAIDFWKAVGYRPFSVTLEIQPDDNP